MIGCHASGKVSVTLGKVKEPVCFAAGRGGFRRHKYVFNRLAGVFNRHPGVFVSLAGVFGRHPGVFDRQTFPIGRHPGVFDRQAFPISRHPGGSGMAAEYARHLAEEKILPVDPGRMPADYENVSAEGKKFPVEGKFFPVEAAQDGDDCARPVTELAASIAGSCWKKTGFGG